MTTFLPQVNRLWNIEDWRKQVRHSSIRSSRFWKTVLDKDPMLDSVRMCIELVYGNGEKMLISTHPIRTFKRSTASGVARNDMEEMAYRPLLMEALPISSSVTCGKGSSSARSFSLNVAQLDFDVFELLRSGRCLAGFGEISLQVDGQWWEDRAVILRGEMSGGVRFGSADEVIDLEIVDPKDVNDMYIPPTLLTKELYSQMPDSFVGSRIPMAINKVNRVPCIRVSDVPNGGPMVWIALQSPLGQHTITDVYVNGEVPGAGVYPRSIVDGTTGNVNHKNIEFTVGTGLWEDNTTVYCDAPMDETKEEIGLIDVIHLLMSEWSTLGRANINEDLFASAKAKCPEFYIPSVLINASGTSSSATALKYVEDVLCKSYPMVSMVWQDGGYGPVYYDRRVDPVMDLRSNQYPLLKRRTSISETPKKDMYNKFTVKFAYDNLENEFKSLVERGVDNSDYCLVSAQQVGSREYRVIESKVMQSGTGAIFTGASGLQAVSVLDWLVNHKTLPSYYAEYDAYTAIYFKLRLGDNIVLYDEEISDEPISATVEKLEVRGGKAVIGLRMWVMYDYIGRSGLGALT